MYASSVCTSSSYSQLFDGDADHELVLGTFGEEARPLSFGQGSEDLFEGDLLVGVVESLLRLFCVPDGYLPDEIFTACDTENVFV